MGDELDELLGRYFELGVAEGAQGRSHDTETGEAQATLDLIRIRIEGAITSATAEAFERAAQIAEARLPLYTHIAAINAVRECVSSIRAEASKKGGAT